MCIRDRWESGRIIHIEREREREIILFDVGRSYEELIEKIKRERISIIVDVPCYEDSAEISRPNNNVDNYIECLPVLRRGVFVVDDSEIERLKYLGVIDNNTDGDKTKINDLDRVYNLIIMWDNPVDYYVGFTEIFEILEKYYIINNNEMSVMKDDNCYMKIRLLYDDGG